jgi:hypothetical protein
MKPTAPPEAFTREHAIEDDMPDLPEATPADSPTLDSPAHKAWLERWNNGNAAEREADTIRALDAAGVPAGVEIRPGVVSHFPADRVRWLAARHKDTR